MKYIANGVTNDVFNVEQAHKQVTGIRRKLGLFVAHGEQRQKPEPEPLPTVSEVLVEGLVALGAKYAFGLFGGGIAPFYEATSRSSLQIVLCRHEGGAAFSAIEASLASGRLTVVVSTTGPGVTNLYTGMVAARCEGAKVLFVSGCTRAQQRGRFAFQETGGGGSPLSALYSSGSLFHYANAIEDPAEIETVLARLAAGISQPGGFVAHIGLPTNLQSAPAVHRHRTAITSIGPAQSDTATVAAVQKLLVNGSFVIWAGFGARDAAAEVRTLAELANVRVMCSPRGKGILPENHPLYLGVTGLGGSSGIEEYLARARPARVLVLGSRLGEMSSFWSESLIPKHGIVHVDIDSNVFGAAYPGTPTVGVPVEVGSLLRGLIKTWPNRAVSGVICLNSEKVRPTIRPQPGRVRPSYLMQVIQSIVVEKSRAIVLTEAGNSFALGNHYLRFMEPKRYRVSTSFGSMGHATAGVLGAALGSGRKAVAIVGDGALLMLNEISSAANYGIDAVWIVLNDSRYGMISQGMESLGWTPFETDFPEADFVGIAEAMGASGIRVESEAALEVALVAAMRTKGPCVVDVIIDREERAPTGQRNQSLLKQANCR